MMLTVGSCFSGIEGFGLGFERAGAKVIWNCEIDANCRKVLRHHWPGVPRFKDVRTVTGAGLRAAGLVPDILVGGFPCQDLSVAGARAGLDGERSGLFFEFARIAEEAKPEWLVIENVPGLLSAGCKPPCVGGCVATHGGAMGTVLGTLADIGYYGAWRVLDAQYLGVAQRRRRVFLVFHLGDGRRAAQVLLEPEGGGGDPPSRNGADPITTGSAEGSTGGRSRYTGAQGADGALSANGVGTCGADDNQGQAGHLLAVPDLSNALCSNRGQRNDHNEQTFLPVAFRKLSRDGDDKPSGETWAAAQSANTLDAGGNVTRTAQAVVTPVAFHMTQDPITSEDISPAIGGVKPTTGYATVAVAVPHPLQYHGLRANASQTGSREVLQVVCRTIGEEAFSEWAVGITAALREAEVLQPCLHGDGLRCQASERRSELDGGTSAGEEAGATGAVCDLWPVERLGRTSPRRQLAEQLARELGAYLSRLPYPGTSRREALQDLWWATQGLGAVQQALNTLQEMGRPTTGEGQPTQPTLAVRRLVPVECLRLMAFPDDWLDDLGLADSVKYRMVGNSVVVNVVEWIARRILKSSDHPH